MVAAADSPAAAGGARPSGGRPLRAGGLLQYGTALLRYGLRRAGRGGPRLLLCVAAFVTALLVVLSGPLARTAGGGGGGGGGSGGFWPFPLGVLDRLGGGAKRRKRPPEADANARDAAAGGGLRVVVFGENDVATSRLQNIPLDGRALRDNNSTAWTEELCVELRCTTYQSFVPALDLPRRSLSSNALYGEATDAVLAAARGAKPADDFSYVATAYPVPADGPDLRAQIDAFLAQPPPPRPPRDTVWIVSVGPWDVWSLAAFPAGPAQDLVVAMVGDLFAQIEALFQAAQDPRSAAYSDPTAVPRDAAGKEIRASAPAPAALPWPDAASAPFRVMVPLLLDPSVLPGWKMERPAAPLLHTKPEHVRRAVRLTQLWNERVEAEMAQWVAKSGTTEASPTPSQASQTSQASEASPEPSIDGFHKAGFLSMKPANGTTPHSRRADPPPPGRPALHRDGTVFPMADYILDAMIDGQLKAGGLTDRRKFGTLPAAEAFAFVRKPCLGTATASTAKPYTVEIGSGSGGKAGLGPKTSRPPDTASVNTPPGLVVCDAPDRHLFFTPFSLGRRAIQEVGRLGAALLRAEPGVRAAWRAARAESGADRAPASWKEYYMA